MYIYIYAYLKYILYIHTYMYIDIMYPSHRYLLSIYVFPCVSLVAQTSYIYTELAVPREL